MSVPVRPGSQRTGNAHPFSIWNTGPWREWPLSAVATVAGLRPISRAPVNPIETMRLGKF